MNYIKNTYHIDKDDDNDDSGNGAAVSSKCLCIHLSQNESR